MLKHLGWRPKETQELPPGESSQCHQPCQGGAQESVFNEYLMSNSDGFEWNMNPSAYAKWLGVDYEKSGRSVRKAIDDGIKDLKDNGYLKEEKGNYIISEQIVPEWKLGTNCSSKASSKEQIVPNLYGF